RAGRRCRGQGPFLQRGRSVDVGAGQGVEVDAFGVAQERGDQHHHLDDAVADGGLFVLVAAGGGVVQPEGGDDQDVGGGGVEFVGGGAHHAGLDQAAHDLVGLFVGAAEDAREAHAQAAVAAEDVDQV